MEKETRPQTAGPATPGGAANPQTKTPGSVREKTLRHMRELLAKTAVAGGALQLACCQTPPIVCDPLPPPLCGLTPSEISTRVTVWGRWEQETGGLAAAVGLYVHASNTTFSGQPVLEGADLVSSDTSQGWSHASFSFSPSAGVTAVRASLTLTCDDGATTTLHLMLDVSGTPLEGGEIPVTVEG